MLKGCDAEIVRIFAEVLEKQVFLFPDPIDVSELSSEPEKLLASSMTFTGKPAGKPSPSGSGAAGTGGKCDGGLVLAVPEALARTIAANFLGMDEDDPIVEQHGSDALGEILNVICGHLLTALYGRDEVFDLSIPRPFSLAGEAASILARKSGCYAFSIDDHQVLLQASFCDPIPRLGPNAIG